MERESEEVQKIKEKEREKHLKYGREYSKFYYEKHKEERSQINLLRFYRNKIGNAVVDYFIETYGYEIGLIKLKVYIKEQYLERLMQEYEETLN